MGFWSYIMGLREVIFMNDFRYFPSLVISRLYNYLKPKGLNFKVLTPLQTISRCNKKKLSLIRFGDADVRILMYGNIYYQKSTPELRAALRKILNEYDDKKSPYLLSIRAKINEHDKELKKTNEMQYWAPSKHFYNFNGNSKLTYGEAALFYATGLPEKEAFKLWEGRKNIVILSFDKKIFNAFQKKFKKCNCYFVKSPETQAFQIKDRLRKNILSVIKENNLKPKDTAILLSAGPAARVLIYELSKMGYLAHDMGTYFGISSREIKHGLIRGIFRKDKKENLTVPFKKL